MEHCRYFSDTDNGKSAAVAQTVSLFTFSPPILIHVRFLDIYESNTILLFHEARVHTINNPKSG